MKTLIERGMLFGGLKRIDEPHLVERYNRALNALNLPSTTLTTFHVDAAGYSPEVAAEIGESYLDPRGVNRMFIILSPDQRRKPIIRASFSADLTVYRRFLDANARAIETLTLHDAVYGEMENLVLDVTCPADIIGFKTVTFEVHTPSGMLEAAKRLEGLVTRFVEEQGSWRDTSLMESIVEGARKCGDIRRNGIVPTATRFEWPDLYHTTHLGGAYVIRYDDGVIMFGNPEHLVPVPSDTTVYPIGDAERALFTLEHSNLLESLNVDWLMESRVFEHRIAMVTADLLISAGVPFDPHAVLDEKRCPRLIHQHHDAVLKGDARFRALTQARAVASNGGDLEGFVSRLPAEHQLMFRRALPDVEDVWEVNRFLAEFTCFDPVTTFIVNKPLFYDMYSKSGESRRAFAAEAVTTVYLPMSDRRHRNKSEVKARFFGIHQ